MSKRNLTQITTSKHLPTIPKKRYFAIGEVAELCYLKPHVLRYWEQEFAELSPTKRRGNRRYYMLEDIQVVRKIRTLLYEKGFTIEGARSQLKKDKTTTSAKKSKEKAIIDLQDNIRALTEIADLLENKKDLGIGV